MLKEHYELFQEMMPRSIHRSSHLRQAWATGMIRSLGDYETYPDLLPQQGWQWLFLQLHPSLSYFRCGVNGIMWGIEVQRGKGWRQTQVEKVSEDHLVDLSSS